MLTWSDLLDAYEASVVVLERAVEAREIPNLPAWRAPDRRPSELPTSVHWERFVGLQQRESRCQAAVGALLDEISNDLTESRLTALAAHAYTRPGQRPLPG